MNEPGGWGQEPFFGFLWRFGFKIRCARCVVSESTHDGKSKTVGQPANILDRCNLQWPAEMAALVSR